MIGFAEHNREWANFEKNFPREKYPLENKRIRRLFDDLVCRLSYESLYEDGELSESEAFQKEKDLTMKLRKLERKVGRKLEDHLHEY